MATHTLYGEVVSRWLKPVSMSVVELEEGRCCLVSGSEAVC